LNAYSITASRLPPWEPTEELRKEFDGAPAGMCEAAATAVVSDADIVVTENPDWFPYYDKFEKRNVLLANPAVLLRQCEIYARGNDVTWAFNYPMFDAPWSTFYFLAESQALNSGMVFLEMCHKKGVDAGARELGRSLIYNRLPNIFRDACCGEDAADGAEWG
jgi:hypothetical protein